MSCRPLRLVHAADFHLERPLHGLSEVPEQLRERFIDAPYRAAERVFDTALAEEADFILLSGDLLAPQSAGPRGLVFLDGQFQRLAERDIAVFWAAGRVDADDQMPPGITFPDNVRRFPQGEAQDFLHDRDGEAVARIIGAGYQRGSKVAVGDFRPDPTGLFTLAVAYGQVTPAALKQQRVHYLALGGRHDRFTCSASPQGAHFPGTPQGRCPDESGPHGCTVVTVDESGRPRTRFAPTDAVRWVNERVVFEAHEPLDKIGDHLVQRMQEIRQRSGEIDLVVCWSITAAGADHNRAAAAKSLLQRLRDGFKNHSPLAWSASLTIEPPDHRLAPREHNESILAELLRLVDQHRGDEQTIDLSEVLPDRHSGSALASAARMDDAEQRRHLLREVALLGSELLRPHSEANAESEETQA